MGKVKWETVMEELEVKDVEFKEKQKEMVWLKVNPQQLWTGEFAGAKASDSIFKQVKDMEFDATPL